MSNLSWKPEHVLPFFCPPKSNGGDDHRFGHLGRVGAAHQFLRVPLLVGTAHPTSTPPDFVSGRNDDQGCNECQASVVTI